MGFLPLTEKVLPFLDGFVFATTDDRLPCLIILIVPLPNRHYSSIFYSVISTSSEIVRVPFDQIIYLLRKFLKG